MSVRDETDQHRHTCLCVRGMKGHRRTSLFPTSCTCVGIPFHQNPVFLASTSAIHYVSYLLPAAGCENAGSARLGSLTSYKSGILTAHLPGLQTDPRKQEMDEDSQLQTLTLLEGIVSVCNGVTIQAQAFEPHCKASATAGTGVRCGLWSAPPPQRPTSHARSQTLFVLLSPCCHLSPSLGATPVPAERFNDLLNSTTRRWLCRCRSISAAEPHEPAREAGNKANSDTLNSSVV